MAGARARRYARAVFELASEEKVVETWARRLQVLREVLTDPRLQPVLDNPAVPVEEKQALIESFEIARLGREGENLAKLLVANHRTHLIGELVEEFDRLADEAAGRVRATATAAVELSAGDLRRLAGELSDKLGREVRVDVRVDPSILGGLILQFGDRVIDLSLATRLQQLRRRLAVS